MNYNPGDIILVDFPFAEGRDSFGKMVSKMRPALIMTIPDSYGDFTAIALSTKAHHLHTIPVRANDLAHGRTTMDSYVRADKIYSVNGAAVQQRVGVVKPDFLNQVRKLMCPIMGCK